MLRIKCFNFQMTGGAEECAGRTVDAFRLFGRGKIFRIVTDPGKCAINLKFVRKSLFAFAASQTGNFAVFAFIRCFFGRIAINMHLTVKGDKFDHLPGTGGDASSAADAKFLMNDRKLIDIKQNFYLATNPFFDMERAYSLTDSKR